MRISIIACLTVCWWAVPCALVDGGAAHVSIHQIELDAHRHVPTDPSLLAGRGAAIMPLQTRDVTARPCATVFGYLPYWSSSDHLHFDLLTHLACFSVEVNENGSLGNDHGWPWTNLINQAHASGVKVILVATLFDEDDIHTLITTPAYKTAFFANIKAKMLEGGADGVNIDFEGGGSAWKMHINSFMAELTAYLHAELSGSEVTFAGPAVNWGGAWDLPGLAASCDGVFIMGYAFWGSWSGTSGPNAPLVGGSYNIADTVVNQYAAVTQHHPKKLILGVPYYGHHWTTTSSAPRASVTSFLGSTRFYNDEPDSHVHELLWETASETPWFRWHDGASWHQVWFDNVASLGLKYDLAAAHELQGVGMWALGYDGARPELWDLLREKFGGCYNCCDFDDDGDTDSDDLAAFYFCTLGPDMPYGEGHYCRAGDTDEDMDVDLADLAVFQALLKNWRVPRSTSE